MSDILLLLTAVSIGSSSLYAWRLSRDPLHPVPLIGLMFAYMYVLRPLLMLQAENVADYLTQEQVNRGLLVNYFCVSGFCLGGILSCRKLDKKRLALTMSQKSRDKVHSLGVLLGTIGCVGYILGLLVSGGFSAVYSHAKGHIISSTGYLGELPLLCYPAIMLVMLARRGRTIRRTDWGFAICFAMPQLLHGILGARRGPTFLIVATLFLSWFIASGRRPKVMPLLLSLVLAGSLIFFLISHRDQIYLGSSFDVDVDKVWNTAFPTTASTADDVIFGIGLTNISEATGRHYWGSRILVVLLARPIPRQIWPSKYEDTGLVGWCSPITSMDTGFMNGVLTSDGVRPAEHPAGSHQTCLSSFGGEHHLEHSCLEPLTLSCGAAQ